MTGCALRTDTHNESFGPKVTNNCSQAVIAAIGGSLEEAETQARDSPITMQPGRRSTIAYNVQDKVVPDRLFLKVGVDADSTATLEIETAAVRLTTIELVFEADCRTLSPMD